MIYLNMYFLLPYILNYNRKTFHYGRKKLRKMAIYVYEKTSFLMGMNIVFYCIYVLLLSASNIMTNEFSLNKDTYQKYIFLKIQNSELKYKSPQEHVDQTKENQTESS